MDSAIKGIKQAKSAWIDSILKEHIPASVYAKVHSGDPKVKAEGLAWVKERGYSHKQEGEMVIVQKGFKVLAQTRLMLDLEKPEDLRALARVVKLRQNGDK